MVEGFEASCGFVGGRFGRAIRNRAACSHIRYRCTHSTASRPHSCQSHQVLVHTLHSVKVTRDTHVCVSNSQGGMLPTFTSGTGTHIPQRQGHTAVSHTAGRERCYQRSHRDSATLMIPVAWRSNVTLHLPEAEYQRGRGGYIVSPARDVVQRTNNHTSQEAPYYGRASANGYGHFPKI